MNCKWAAWGWHFLSCVGRELGLSSWVLLVHQPISAIPQAWLLHPLQQPWEVPSLHSSSRCGRTCGVYKGSSSLFPPSNVGSCLVSGELTGGTLRCDGFCVWWGKYLRGELRYLQRADEGGQCTACAWVFFFLFFALFWFCFNFHELEMPMTQGLERTLNPRGAHCRLLSRIEFLTYRRDVCRETLMCN